MSTTAASIRVTDPVAFGTVAVLMGGASAEREISLLSGQAVLAALLERGVDAHAVDTAENLMAMLCRQRYSRAWIALHGRGGEDGTIQGLLEFMDIAYTGSGVKGSAIGMDKLRTKQLLTGAGLATPEFRVLHGPEGFDRVIDELGLPLMIKPAEEGSSIGLSRVERREELSAAFDRAAAFNCEVFAEQWVAGCEYTVAVLQGRALPLVRIDAANTFYDYQAKYFSDETVYVCPSGLTDTLEREFGSQALAAFAAVGAAGWGRVDFMLGPDDRPLWLEVNTIPGMTSHSLVPMAARAAGMEFGDLVWRILETSYMAATTDSEWTEASRAG
ncbi:MAG: D-alanine--D-alanine ligase [Gammaproteobacteria bacterium]|nr:MAG: D-alanine--D-alanine ligase [Gammaproteobacteria bacterium]